MEKTIKTNKKEVLVLGGTGAMGNYLVKILASKGYFCTVTSRKKKQDCDNIKYLEGNAMSVDFLYPLLENKKWEAIIDFMAYNTAQLSSRLEKLLASTSQYVFLSSARVYAKSNHPLTEDSDRLLDVCTDKEYLTTDEYALAKARQENLLYGSKCNNWTIIRPYITFSDYRLQLSALEKEYWLYRALQDRKIVISHDLMDKHTTFTYGYDVAQGIAAIIGEKEALGEAFHITSNTSYTWGEILGMYVDIIKKKTGGEPQIYWTPSWKSFYGGGMYQVKYDRLYDRVFDNSKIGKFIDVTQFSNVREALTKCVDNFLQKPKFLYHDWRSEAQKDKMTGDWAKFSEIKSYEQKLRYFLIRTGIIK